MRHLLFFVLGAALLWIGESVYAHGGQFRGPNGGVPPGLRTPGDPDPPPPPPTDPADPGGETTPTEPDPSGDNKPVSGGNDTGPQAGPPPKIGPKNGGRKRARTGQTASFDNWQFWWAYNSDDIINIKDHMRGQLVTSGGGIRVSGGFDKMNRNNPQRITREKVQRVILPALEERLQIPWENEDVHGGCLVAIGKIGDASHIPLLEAALHNKLKNDRGKHIKLGGQATESAAIALGLLPELDEAGLRAVRRVCIEAVADESLRTRERAWCAVALGLQRDTAAARPLFELLRKDYSNINVPAGILAGLGLMGDDGKLSGDLLEVHMKLRRAFVTRELAGHKQISERLQAFVGYALAKHAQEDSIEALYTVLKRRRFGMIAKRSAAIGVGTIAPKLTDPADKEKAVRALQRFIDRSGDPSAVNFATISLSKVGTRSAIRLLLKYAERGSYGQRPFAALGLGTYVRYQDRANTMNPEQRKDITAKLAAISGKRKDTDTRAAFLLARGLVKDKSAIPELVQIVVSRGDAMLRGFCCVSLGLMEDNRPEIKDALLIALRERRSEDLRRDAATGLGMLRDANFVKVLLEELDKAKSMTVQGQIITALGKLGDRRGVTPLVEILRTRSRPTVTRAMSAVGLGIIGDERDLPELGRVARDYNYRASAPDLDALLYIL